MKKICVINQKGGVGKTTVVVNMAAGLARAGKRVLLIDLDPHANLRECLPIKDEKKNMYHILMENADPVECIHRVAINLDIIISDQSLARAEMAMVNENAKEYVVSRKLRSVKKYDYIIIDCPPTIGLLNQNVLLYADEVVIPASTDYLGVIAAKKMAEMVHIFNESFGLDVQIAKVVPTMYDKRSKICKDSLRELQNAFYEKVVPPIHMTTKLKEAAKRKRSIFSFAAKSQAGKDFNELVRSLLLEDKEADTSIEIDIKEGKKVKA